MNKHATFTCHTCGEAFSSEDEYLATTIKKDDRKLRHLSFCSYNCVNNWFLDEGNGYWTIHVYQPKDVKPVRKRQ